MKKNTALFWLIPIIIILAAFASIVGLLSHEGIGPHDFINVHGQSVQMDGRGIYQYDSLLVAAGFRGTDAVTLLLLIPFLLITFIAYVRGSEKGGILMLGVLLAFLYKGASMTFAAAFNSLFLIYAALFSTSLFAVILVMTSIDSSALSKRIKPGFSYKATAIFLFIAGIGTLFFWMSEILPSMFSGNAPEILGPYTTLFTHGFDSAVITPACIIAGVNLLKKRPLGYFLAAPMLLLCTQIGLVVIGQTVYQSLAGFVFPIGTYIGLIGSWVVMGTFATCLAISFLRHVSA